MTYLPDPSVAATREKVEPAIPPGLNCRFVYRTGESITSANLFDPPGDAGGEPIPPQSAPPPVDMLKSDWDKETYGIYQ